MGRGARASVSDAKQRAGEVWGLSTACDYCEEMLMCSAGCLIEGVSMRAGTSTTSRTFPVDALRRSRLRRRRNSACKTETRGEQSRTTVHPQPHHVPQSSSTRASSTASAPPRPRDWTLIFGFGTVAICRALLPSSPPSRARWWTWSGSSLLRPVGRRRFEGPTTEPRIENAALVASRARLVAARRRGRRRRRRSPRPATGRRRRRAQARSH